MFFCFLLLCNWIAVGQDGLTVCVLDWWGARMCLWERRNEDSGILVSETALYDLSLNRHCFILELLSLGHI